MSPSTRSPLSSPLTSLLLASLAFLLLPRPAAAGDWPHWRGPAFDGSAPEDPAFAAEHLALEEVWKRPLGSGYSGVTVMGTRAVTLATDGETDFVIALDTASGEELWRHPLGSVYKGHDGSDDGPLNTPTLENNDNGGTVYAIGPKGKLAALSLEDGRELWTVQLETLPGARPPYFGYTTSPLVLDDLLVVATGGEGGHAFTAFDKATGTVRWTSGDDVVEYQSPLLVELGGERQILALGNQHVVGLDPTDGHELWRHAYSPEARNSSSQQMLLPGNRLLVHVAVDTVLFQLEPDGAGGATVTELWRADTLGSRLSTPVYFEEHLYGFDGRFLTCVRAADGTMVWKSRPPGGTGLLRVGDHLVIYGARGEVVVARATPEGYDERARIDFSGRSSVTYPSYGDGKIFVRDLEEIGAYRVAAAPPPPEEAPAAPRNRFEVFLQRLSETPYKRPLVDEFFATTEAFPLVEDGQWVHFVYRGPAKDVGIRGSMTPEGREETLERAQGTDLFYKTYPADEARRWEYQFNVDFENPTPDPLNPRRVPATHYWEEADMSEVFLKAHDVDPHLLGARPTARGRLETFTLTSAILETPTREGGEEPREVPITVYLPPGYEEGETRYPVVVVNEGDLWLERGQLPNSLDHLLASTPASGGLPPLIAVFVPRGGRGSWEEQGGSQAGPYGRMLAEELVPHLDRNYRTRPEPAARVLLGRWQGATAAVWTALHHPEIFGHAAALSYEARSTRPAIEERIEALPEAARPTFAIWWNLNEAPGTEADPDLRRDGRDLKEKLEAAGYTVQGGESPDSGGWGSWRALVDDALRGLLVGP